jgi:hypothetical protein
MKRNVESIVGATVVSVRYYKALSETDTVMVELSDGVKLACKQIEIIKLREK